MTSVFGVGDAKKHFSELMSRAAYKGERFLIERRGRPMAALVPAKDLDRLEEQPAQPTGLLAAVGAWAEYDDLDGFTSDVYRQRRSARDRPVKIND